MQSAPPTDDGGRSAHTPAIIQLLETASTRPPAAGGDSSDHRPAKCGGCRCCKPEALVEPFGAPPAEKPPAWQLNDAAHLERLTLLGEMVLGLAHEINQPVTAARNFARACLHWRDAGGSPLPPEVARMIEMILGQTDRAAAIVNRLSAFVGKGPSTKSLADLNELVDNAIALARNCLLEDAGGTSELIKIEKELAPRLPQVEVDPIQIEQVLINLIRNGIEATREAGCLAPVVIRTMRAGNALQAAVSDGGEGVPTSAGPHLFEPFFTTKPHGMGLGLSISRSIIESHGGVLWAENNAKGGATFFFTLPLAG